MHTLDPRTLHQFREILDSIASAREYVYAFHLIVDRLERLFKCQTCAILLVDPESEYLKIESSYGLSHTFCKAFRRKLSTGPVGELLWTGVPVLITDAARRAEEADQLRLEHSFASCAAVQLTSEHQSIGYLYMDSPQRDAFDAEDLEVLQIFGDAAAIAHSNACLHDRVKRLDTVDHESGVGKITPFLENLEGALERAANASEHFSVVIGDIDNFKEISHVHGSASSGRLLKELGTLLRSELRVQDSLARFGPDEFIILRASESLEDGIRFANTVRKSIQERSFVDDKIRTTISLGVAGFPSNGKSVDDIILTAKKALFEAQRAGRNKVFHYPSTWYASENAVHDNE